MTKLVACLVLLPVACSFLPIHSEIQVMIAGKASEQDSTAGSITDHVEDEVLSIADTYLEKYVAELKKNKTVNLSRNRTKRAWKALASFSRQALTFVMGRKALASLLSGAVKSKKIVDSGRTLIQYNKPGGFTKAHADFRSVGPTDVIDIKPTCDGGKGKLGYVGDRTIKIISCENDQMVKLVITRFVKNDKKVVHVISYN